MRRFFLPVLAAILLLGTSASGDKRCEDKSSPVSDTTETATDSILKFWLKGQVVDCNKPFHATLWCWISETELDTIRELNSFLWDSKAYSPAETIYANALNDPKQKENPYAKLLSSGDFQRKKSAWPCYWTSYPKEARTVIGTRDQLVQVQLEDSAWILVFRPDQKTAKAFSVFDLKGNPVSFPEFEKNKNRLAAVFIYGNLKTEKSAKKIPYRSFILCNERMIRSWHHGVPGVQNQVAKDMNYLMLLYAWAEAHPEKTSLNASRKFPSCWNGLPEGAGVKDYYVAAKTDMANEKMHIASELKMSIDFIRSNWRSQVKPAENFPSRGLR